MKYSDLTVGILKGMLIDEVNRYDKAKKMMWDMYDAREVDNMFRDMIQDQIRIREAIVAKLKR